MSVIVFVFGHLPYTKGMYARTEAILVITKEKRRHLDDALIGVARGESERGHRRVLRSLRRPFHLCITKRQRNGFNVAIFSVFAFQMWFCSSPGERF